MPSPWVPVVMLLVISWRMYNNNMVQHYRERTSGLCDAQSLGLSDLASLLYDPFLELAPRGAPASDRSAPSGGWVRSDGSAYPDGLAHKNLVVVIPLAPGSGPLQIPSSAVSNPCRGRELVADLVDQLNHLGPSVIAVDRYYPAEGGCPPGAAEQQHFVRSLATYPVSPTGAAACCSGMQGSTAPAIVVGLNSLVTPEANDAASGSAPVNCLVESRPLKFQASSSPPGTPPTAPRTVHTGLLRLNSDALEIPLEWWVAPEDKHSGDRGKAVSGFAFAVYKQAVAPLTQDQRAHEDPSVSDDQLTRTSLAKMIKSYDHPFARFPKKDGPVHVAPKSIFCADPAGKQVLADFLQKESGLAASPAHAPIDPAMCNGTSPLPSLNGNIVVIGVDAPEQDRHPLLQRDVLGVDLQAEYIEALLNQSYVMAAPWWLDWGLVAVLFTEIFTSEFFFDRKKLEFWHSYLLDTGSLLLLLLVAILLLRHGWLTANFLGTAGAIFITGLVTRAMERAKEVRKEERESQA